MNENTNAVAATRPEDWDVTLSNVDISLFTINCLDESLVFINRHGYKTIEKMPADILHKHYSAVFCAEFSSVIGSLLAKTKAGGSHSMLYYWHRRAFWGQVSAHRAVDSHGNKLAVFSVVNVTETRRMEYEYQRMAFYDAQLNIPNGLKMEKDVAGLPSFDNVALIHFDIDRFGTINDVFGWDTGDYLLLQIRDWMLKTAVPGCRLYRAGEDEFAMLITDISLENAKKRALEVIKRFKKPWKVFQQNTLPLYCTVTMGLVYGEYLRGETRNQIFRTIGVAGTSGSLTLYDAAMDRQYKDKLLMRQTLISSMQQNMMGFSLEYQPILEAKTLKWFGGEALCRWNCAYFGDVRPHIFIKDLEQMGLIEQLDDWVLKTALEECRKHGLHDNGFVLDVNLSPLHTIDEEYTRRLCQTLNSCRFPFYNLSLEITESERFRFSSDSMQHLQFLANKGVRIALDDFGTGYSSFDNLTKLPATVLKTEPAFIKNLETDSYLQYLLQILIDLAHTAGMRVIVEGVETEKQRELLTGYGADYLQGFLFSKPLSIEEFSRQYHQFQ